MVKVVVIGNLGVAVDALTVMKECNGCEIALVISHPGLRGVGDFVRLWCERHGVPYAGDGDVNSEATLKRIAKIAPDYLFSIYNPTIIRKPLLALPSRTTINLHAGPLPGYRGIFTFSWAIINGEKRYGVAWHEVEEQIDTGQVLFQRMFDVAADETALSLSRKSFATGVDLLRERLPELMAGTLKAQGTPDGESRYFGRKDLPNAGRVDFSWPFEKIDRFVRGLNYYPAPNPFVLATVTCADGLFHPLQVERAPPAVWDGGAKHQPGTVLAVHSHQIVVQAADGPVSIQSALNARLRRVSPGALAEELCLGPGTQLS